MARKRCYGCMQLKTQSPVCEHCGYNELVPNEPHQLPKGTVLAGQYMVGKVLGQGGFGITYLGWDEKLDIPVAIKEYYPGALVNRDTNRSFNLGGISASMNEAYTSTRNRFLREAKTLARLRYIPQIVQVYNFFEENNTAYIIMEYVQGIDLRRYINLRGGRLSAQETLSILRPVMEALRQVHEQEIVHRDISPDNIMMLPDGSAKLLDFGAVRSVENADAERELQRSTEAILKHGFAPMEQYQTRGALGPWTDEYALCATAYYCMTGRVPPEAPQRMMEDVHPDWNGIPGLTEEQRRALETGMALRAKDRFPTVGALHQALFAPPPVREDYPVTKPLKREETVLETKTEPVPLPDASPKKTGSKINWKKWLPYIIAAVLFMSMVLVSVRDNEKKPVPKEPAQTQTTPANSDAEAIPGGQGEADAPYAGTEGSAYEETGSADQPGWEDNLLDGERIRGSLYLGKIKTVTFLNTQKDAPSDCWDASKGRNGSVVAWAEDNGGYYDVYVAGEGGINAKDSCEKLFFCYSSLESIHFGKAFHTEGAQSMSDMFHGCYWLKDVDVRYFDTSSVTDMSGMFWDCHYLEELDVSGFDTSNVTNMAYMFAYTGLQELDVSGFDTSSVRHMNNMFSGCKFSQIDVSGFDTSLVLSMKFMFYGSENLKDLDLRSWKLSRLLSDGGTWFMDEGDTINGKPWEKFFE